MNRFTQSRGRLTLSKVWQYLSLLFLIGFVIFFITGVTSVDNTTTEEQAKSLETAVRRSIAQCYAVEGTYPPSLDYLKEHYGLIYDTESYYIDYTAIGSNIMPDVTILPRSESEIGFMDSSEE
jgi:ABC-type dipeptide/oligopeptide/nickel transport system permease component